MNNVELVKQVYANFAPGNIPGVLGAFHPEIEWHECSGLPFVSGDGVFSGPDAVVQNVFAQIPEYFEGFHIDVENVFGTGDNVAMSGYYKGIWKATGKAFKANATHVWTARDGKLTRFFQALDTAEIMNS